MDTLFNGRFWVSVIASTIFTMIMIYAIKRFSTAYQVPVLKELSSAI